MCLAEGPSPLRGVAAQIFALCQASVLHQILESKQDHLQTLDQLHCANSELLRIFTSTGCIGVCNKTKSLLVTRKKEGKRSRYSAGICIAGLHS